MRGKRILESYQNRIHNDSAQVKMHEGEIDIDIALVRQLLTQQFPHLAERPITVVRSTGTVNAIFRLGQDLYVRLPRVGTWAEDIDREWTWLPKLAPHISLNVPKPFAKGKPTNWYPYPWAIYHWLEGTPYQNDLIGDERQVAYDLVNFILELRGADMRGAPRGGRRPLIELDAATRSAIRSSGGVIDTQAVSAAWARSLESNLLVQDGRLCAIIDFGGVGIGDPAADVVPAWSVFSEVGRETFRQALDVDDETWRRAHGYALHQALMIIPYYPRTNPEFVTMAKRTIEEILKERIEEDGLL
jgi:aminoglycoside phosphotransferase (APT) family kinase protein